MISKNNATKYCDETKFKIKTSGRWGGGMAVIGF